jgi:hypothetical protein
VEYLYYDVSLRYQGRYGPQDLKSRWFFGNAVTAQDKAQAISIATDTLREELPDSRVVSAFAEESEGQTPKYPERIGLVFD